MRNVPKNKQAAPGDVAASQHLRIPLALYDDRQRKTQEIQALEGEIAGRLVQTPYVLCAPACSPGGICMQAKSTQASKQGHTAMYSEPSNLSLSRLVP